MIFYLKDNWGVKKDRIHSILIYREQKDPSDASPDHLEPIFSYKNTVNSIQKTFQDYTTTFLITLLKELYERLNDFPEENELPIIEFLNEKLMKEILRRFDITKKQSVQRKNLLYQMRLTIALVNKLKENIMNKVKEGGEKDD